MSGDPEQDYFADGMAEDITTALSKVRWFSVVSRNSAFAYKGRQIDVKQAARELGVRYVLEGSVRKAGTRARVTAQLLDAISGHHVWAERYDRDLADIFAVQDEITEQVVAAIEPQLYAAEGIRAKRKPPESFDAWECVVRALALMNSRTRPDVAAANELLRKAIALDPGYAQAHSLLSFVTTLGVHMGWEPRESTLALASDAAHKALFLDSDDPWAHVALGYVLAWSRRADDALVEYERRSLSIRTLPSPTGCSRLPCATSDGVRRRWHMAIRRSVSARATCWPVAMPASAITSVPSPVSSQAGTAMASLLPARR